MEKCITRHVDVNQSNHKAGSAHLSAAVDP